MSCSTARVSDRSYYQEAEQEPITQSLFNDKDSNISEENIQKILNGSYKLPDQLRVAVVKLESKQTQRNYYYWRDEHYLKAQQSYQDMLSGILKGSSRVSQTSIIPSILVSSNPTFTNIRESAVRMQADVVLIYSINCDIYEKYRLFSSTDIKAFATTQVVLMDVRTGLIPFSTIATKDFQSKKQKEDMDDSEAKERVKNQAVLLTMEEIGTQLSAFLNKGNL